MTYTPPSGAIRYEWLRFTVRFLNDASHSHYHIIHFNQRTRTTEASENLCVTVGCTHRAHCRAEAVLCGVSG